MRKFIKEDLLGLIDFLIEAHESIKIEIKKDNDAMLIETLTNCQAIAFQIGTSIEKSEGLNAEVVRVLEDYCDYLYQISIDTRKDKASSHFEHLNRFIQKVKKAIEEIRVKYEVVFLPYKASMWDSLESVWKAAKNDLDCNTYVIPIGYYNKNSDGSFGQFNYEGKLFPKHVPIIHYKDYNIEINRPDVIYIHNPYDNHNKVTSIDPAYYSSQLKRYTNMLVYIPYFISSGKTPEHLIELTGVFNSHRVIVSSEEEKEEYKRVYISVLGEAQEEKERKSGEVNAAFWQTLHRMAEEKFIALGSPKVDAINKKKSHENGISEEWKKLLYSDKGEKRKVILYNTTIVPLLEHKKKMINKIKSSLKIFKENNNILLIWRPHPLMMSSIESILPELASDYKEMVRNYKKEAWGIYDDTTDLNHAINLSDAYYGDGGSVLAAYKETGKPILLQDVEVI